MTGRLLLTTGRIYGSPLVMHVWWIKKMHVCYKGSECTHAYSDKMAVDSLNKGSEEIYRSCYSLCTRASGWFWLCSPPFVGRAFLLIVCLYFWIVYVCGSAAAVSPFLLLIFGPSAPFMWYGRFYPRIFSFTVVVPARIACMGRTWVRALLTLLDETCCSQCHVMYVCCICIHTDTCEYTEKSRPCIWQRVMMSVPF